MFDIIKKRRSISKFEKKKVSLKLIDELITVSSYAPSSCNTQPWFFLVFHSKKSKDKLNKHIDKGYEYSYRELKKKHKVTGKAYAKILDFFSKYGKFNEAPVYILLFARPYDAPLLSQAVKLSKDKKIEKIADESVTTSAAMAMQNFLLAACKKGLGTRVKDGIKFLMNFPSLRKAFYREFKIPSDYKLISGIQVGYPTKEASKKKPLKRLPKNKTRRFI